MNWKRTNSCRCSMNHRNRNVELDPDRISGPGADEIFPGIFPDGDGNTSAILFRFHRGGNSRKGAGILSCISPVPAGKGKGRGRAVPGPGFYQRKLRQAEADCRRRQLRYRIPPRRRHIPLRRGSAHGESCVGLRPQAGSGCHIPDLSALLRSWDAARNFRSCAFLQAASCPAALLRRQMNTEYKYR